MPLHDWTRVTPNDFHDLHVSWIAAIRTRLNTGLLPAGYYAMAEHVVPPFAPDVLTLNTAGRDGPPPPWPGDEAGGDGGGGGGVAVATEVEVTLIAEPRRWSQPPQRRVAVRHVEGRRLVAVIELVSPGNKAKAAEVRGFTAKATALLANGIHLSIVDVFPNPPRLPRGFGGAVWRAIRRAEADYTPKHSRTHSAFAAQGGGGCLAQFLSSEVGAALPALPLYLTARRCVLLPLEETYRTAWAGYPEVLRPALEAPAA